MKAQRTTITGARPLAESPLATRAQSVASVAASHAGEVDADARFPSEAFAEVRRQKLLGVMIPAALGGDGASLADVVDVCYALGQACASTAMIYAMHSIKIGCLLRHGHGRPAIDGVLRRVAGEQLLLASSTTEGQGGGNVRSSEAPVAEQGAGISLERKASVISYGAAADGIVTTARRSADAAASDQVLLVFLKPQYTLEPLAGFSWDTLGMRGTCSGGFTLRAAGTPDNILPDPYEQIHAQTMVPYAHLTWGSVWTGIAAAATAQAQAFVRHAARQASGTVPPGAAHCTQALASLRTLRGLIGSSLRAYERALGDRAALTSLEFQSMITLTKVEASELAVRTVLHATRACGLAGYRNDGPFSVGRHLRDVLSAPIMINNDRILANLATPSLMTPVPGTLSG
jgi:acyl-CoA dehydrogenase